MSDSLSPLQRRLLECLRDAHLNAPNPRATAIYIDAAVGELGTQRSQVIRTILDLKDVGLVATETLDSVKITSEGLRLLDSDTRGQKQWILKSRDYGGYTLAEPGPRTIDEIRAAMREAAGHLGRTGPGAQMHNEIHPIYVELQNELHVALARATSKEPSVHLNISNSTVGNLNLGTQVGTVEAAVTVLASAPDERSQKMAGALKAIAEALDSDSDLPDESKREAFELLAEISAATQSKEAPPRGVTKALVVALGSALGHAASVATVWQAWGPTLRSFFGLP